MRNTPNIIERSGEDVALAAEGSRSKKEQHELQDAAYLLRVFSPDGRLVWNVPNVPAQQLAPDHALEHVRRGTPVFETVETTDGQPVRYLFMKICQDAPLGRAGRNGSP